MDDTFLAAFIEMRSSRKVVLYGSQMVIGVNQRNDTARPLVFAINRSREIAVLDSAAIGHTYESANLIRAGLEFGIGEAVGNCDTDIVVDVHVASDGAYVVAALNIGVGHIAALDGAAIGTAHDSCSICVAHDVGVLNTKILDCGPMSRGKQGCLVLIGIVESQVADDMTLAVKRAGEIRQRAKANTAHVDVGRKLVVTIGIILDVEQVLGRGNIVVGLRHGKGLRVSGTFDISVTGRGIGNGSRACTHEANFRSSDRSHTFIGR